MTPAIISELIERFERNSSSYKSGLYNETQVRLEFINPFFEALGWDVNNVKGYAEAYKDVIHEYSQKTGDTVKAPDYCFRIGGTRKFFIEAKKPGVNLKDDISPAFQLRRYAWSAKLPLSVLTDFEEFAVYDCRIPPKKSDKASTARVMYYTYKDYSEKWDEIEKIFSRDAILKGSFDQYAVSAKGKRGTAEVDETFLKTIEEWRFQLAKNIALRNLELTTRELNFSVQKIIDRIIFLRICEDRGIEEYGLLLTLLNGVNVFARLNQIFTRADEKYNSGLFHFEKEKGRIEEPDELTPKLVIDDKVLKDIISNLYYPESPFEFSVLPADILGQVYEQFLGKVIRLTTAHHAVVEEKPEVRKAGGVYYTPTYIVDYIVQNTLGKILTPPVSSPLIKGRIKEGFAPLVKGSPPRRTKEGFTPKEVSMLKILDPACGSGSFLIQAYQYLLDWHLNYYLNKDAPADRVVKKNSPIYQTQGGEYRLTTTERKRILLNNIYGVDIDSQAVEVTKLSLLLKVLEGENEETLTNQMRMFHERALPDLGSNIKCGNSLIGPDFYDQMEMNFLDDEEKLRINVFDWKKEFPQVFKPHPLSLSLPRRGKLTSPLPLSLVRREMKGEVEPTDEGGFDVVIGNPPYVRQELLGSFKEYFEKTYKVYNGISDLYSYFIEKAVSLLKDGGYFAYIVANKWMRANYGNQLREWLKKQNLLELIDFGDLPVFKGATTYPCILTITKGEPAKEFDFAEIKDLSLNDLKKVVNEEKYKVNLQKLDSSGWKLVKENISGLLNKISSQGIPLSKYVDGKIYRGVLTGLNKAFVIDEETKRRLIKEDAKSKELIKPFLAGRDIKRYSPLLSDKYLIFSRHGIDIKNYPAIEEYLKQFKDELMPKPKSWKGKEWKGRKPGSYKWYELQDTIDYYKEFERPKIIYPNICKRNEFTFDNDNFYTNQKCFIISVDDKYLLGLLNSDLFFFLFRSILPKLRGGFYEPSYVFLKDFPIINTSNEVKMSICDRVDRILRIYKEKLNSKTPQEKTALQRQMDAADKQIDQLVYQLYGLTEEEIRIVEGG